MTILQKTSRFHPTLLRGDGRTAGWLGYVFVELADAAERFEPTATQEAMAPAIEKLL